MRQIGLRFIAISMELDCEGHHGRRRPVSRQSVAWQRGMTAQFDGELLACRGADVSLLAATYSGVRHESASLPHTGPDLRAVCLTCPVSGG